jgi:alpha-L-rhamnosidase
MLAAAAVWFYKYLAGISMENDAVAFQDLVIQPHVPQGLSHVEAAMDTLAGKVSSSWDKTGSRFTLTAGIPFNARARVLIPNVIPGAKTLKVNGVEEKAERDERGAYVLRVGAGKYEFVLQ